MMYARIRVVALLFAAVALLTGCPPETGEPDAGDTGVDQTDTAEPEDAGDVADTADGGDEPVDTDGGEATDSGDTDPAMSDTPDTTPPDTTVPDTGDTGATEPDDADAGDVWQPEGDAIAWCEMQNADAPDCPGPTQPPMGVVCDQLDTCCKNTETGQICRYETRCHIPAVIENNSDWACAP